MVERAVYLHTTTERCSEVLRQIFPHGFPVATEEITDLKHQIIFFEVDDNTDAEELSKLLASNNFFFFILDHDSYTHTLGAMSAKRFFTFARISDPTEDIIIRFNTLVQYVEITNELRRKGEELEDTVFELAFATTNVLEKNEFLEQLANKDSLTLLYNHSFFKDRMKEEFDRASRYGNIFSIALLDLDFFKRVNDTYGHLKGDEVLRTFAIVLKNCIRTSDIGARYGGEEFAVIFPETDMNEAKAAVERIRTAFADTSFEHHDTAFKVTFSAGITTYSDGIEDFEQMIQLADTALYSSKSTGRNKTTTI